MSDISSKDSTRPEDEYRVEESIICRYQVIFTDEKGDAFLTKQPSEFRRVIAASLIKQLVNKYHEKLMANDNLLYFNRWNLVFTRFKINSDLVETDHPMKMPFCSSDKSGRPITVRFVFVGETNRRDLVPEMKKKHTLYKFLKGVFNGGSEFFVEVVPRVFFYLTPGKKTEEPNTLVKPAIIHGSVSLVVDGQLIADHQFRPELHEALAFHMDPAPPLKMEELIDDVDDVWITGLQHGSHVVFMLSEEARENFKDVIAKTAAKSIVHVHEVNKQFNAERRKSVARVAKKLATYSGSVVFNQYLTAAPWFRGKKSWVVAQTLICALNLESFTPLSDWQMSTEQTDRIFFGISGNIGGIPQIFYAGDGVCHKNEIEHYVNASLKWMMETASKNRGTAISRLIVFLRATDYQSTVSSGLPESRKNAPLPSGLLESIKNALLPSGLRPIIMKVNGATVGMGNSEIPSLSYHLHSALENEAHSTMIEVLSQGWYKMRKQELMALVEESCLCEGHVQQLLPVPIPLHLSHHALEDISPSAGDFFKNQEKESKKT